MGRVDSLSLLDKKEYDRAFPRMNYETSLPSRFPDAPSLRSFVLAKSGRDTRHHQGTN